ncbi:hypothetical protein P692DRAFT_20869010 [Suillus brevipes Sb2]|nr:hypothetical protein P692DRAFT_20869010 [Suillus brevipes Sb2]
MAMRTWVDALGDHIRSLTLARTHRPRRAHPLDQRLAANLVNAKNFDVPVWDTLASYLAFLAPHS